MKKYFKLGTALAFLFAANFAPALTPNVYATESTNNTNIVETPLATEQYNANAVTYDYSNIEVEEPLEVKQSSNEVSTAEANNVLDSAPARAPTLKAANTSPLFVTLNTHIKDNENNPLRTYEYDNVDATANHVALCNFVIGEGIVTNERVIVTLDGQVHEARAVAHNSTSNLDYGTIENPIFYYTNPDDNYTYSYIYFNPQLVAEYDDIAVDFYYVYTDQDVDYRVLINYYFLEEENDFIDFSSDILDLPQELWGILDDYSQELINANKTSDPDKGVKYYDYQQIYAKAGEMIDEIHKYPTNYNNVVQELGNMRWGIAADMGADLSSNDNVRLQVSDFDVNHFKSDGKIWVYSKMVHTDLVYHIFYGVQPWIEVKHIVVDGDTETLLEEPTIYYGDGGTRQALSPKTVEEVGNALKYTGVKYAQAFDPETVHYVEAPRTIRQFPFEYFPLYGHSMVNYYYEYNSVVNVHYIDKDGNHIEFDQEGNAVTSQKTVYGKVGDPYENMDEIQPIEIAGYKYVSKSSNDFSTDKVFAKDPIEIYYTYMPLGKIIAKYVDVDTGYELALSYEDSGIVGKPYSTEAKEIANYELESISGNANGLYELGTYIEPYVITYYYTRPTTNVITHYVDVDDTTKELASQDVKPGKVGQDYTTVQLNNIENYTCVGNSNNIEGTYQDQDIHVYYYYKKDSGTVTAYYIDNKNFNIIDERTTPGYVGDPYQTEELTIPGYRFVTRIGNDTGSYIKDDIKVYYYYEQVGKVIVKYLEEGTNNVLLEEQVLVDPIGSEYTTYDYYKANINNYHWVRTEGNERGRYTTDDQEVIYYYELDQVIVTGDLVVNYIDQDNNLLDSWTDTQEVGTEYTTEAKEIAGYTPKFVIGNPTGTYSTGTTTVTYVYEKIPEVVYGTLKVNYIDTNNNLLDSWTDTQEVGTEYTTEQKSFEGYTPKFVIGEIAGTYSTGTTTVTYVYEKIPETLSGEVVVKYIENTGRKLIDEDIVISGEYGTEYTTEQKSFDGYNFVAVYGPTQGTIDQPKTTVIYMYEKVKSDETGTGSCNNNCGCNCCSSCNNTCNNSCDNGEQEPTQPIINIDITINNDNSTEVNNENNNQDENNVNNENSPVNNTDVDVETGDNVNNNSNNSENNAEGGNATNGDTNVNVETGDNNTNVENNANLVSGDTNIENNPAINIENNPENNNDVNVENNTNVENNPVNTVETGDNTITTGDTNIENNTNVETGDVDNSSEATTGDVENNTTVETGDVTNTNTAEGGNNTNDNTVEIKDNTLNNEANGGETPGTNNTNVETGDVNVDTGDNTNTNNNTVEGGDNTNNNNNENNNENNNSCTECNDQEGNNQGSGDNPPTDPEDQSSDTPKTGEVVAHYVDIYGNMIGIDMPYEGQVGDRYNTVLRSFRGYRLAQVVGARSGQFEDGMIDVTYIYEKLPTGSTTGYDIPENNNYNNYASNLNSSKYSRVTIPNTSVSNSKNLIVLLINLITLISLGLYKKFAN